MSGNGVNQDLGFFSTASDGLASLLEAGDVGDKSLHIVEREIWGGHAAGFHLVRGVLQQLGELARGEFRAYAD